jgi:hypothetical protein
MSLANSNSSPCASWPLHDLVETLDIWLIPRLRNLIYVKSRLCLHEK